MIDFRNDRGSEAHTPAQCNEALAASGRRCTSALAASGRHWKRRVFFQAEDGIRDLVRSRGLGDVYKRQVVEISSSRPCRSLVALLSDV